MRFLHAADIHLDSPLAGLRQRAGARGDELADATRRAFRNMVQYAIDEKIELMLIAGDNYDGRHRNYESLLFFAREMERLRRAGVRTVMIRGNHDAENQMQLRMPEGVHVLSADRPQSVSFDDLGVVVHGQSFPQREVRQNLVASYPLPVAGLFNIGLLHAAVDGYGGSHERYAPCTVGDLTSKNYEYWALGHVHERAEIARKPWIVYSGNLQARHINESGPKGATLVTVTDGLITKVTAVPFDVVRWSRVVVDVSTCVSIEAVSSGIEAALVKAADDAEGRTLVARLELNGRTQTHRELKLNVARLEAEAAHAAEVAGDIWIERIQLSTEDAVYLPAASHDAISGLLSEVDALRKASVGREKLREAVTALPNKLPVALRKEIGLDGIDDSSLDQIVNDARDILLAKLVR